MTDPNAQSQNQTAPAQNNYPSAPHVPNPADNVAQSPQAQPTGASQAAPSLAQASASPVAAIPTSQQPVVKEVGHPGTWTVIRRIELDPKNFEATEAMIVKGQGVVIKVVCCVDGKPSTSTVLIPNSSIVKESQTSQPMVIGNQHINK